MLSRKLSQDDLTIFLGLDNHFYLSKNSCLDHCYHPHQQSESILRGQKDMACGDFDLLTYLCSVNVSPMQICQIMEQVKGPEAGTYQPKCVYDINQRTEDLKNFAIGLLPKSNDAVKTIAKLER